jgi:sugar lactone lactonase YvrE
MRLPTNSTDLPSRPHTLRLVWSVTRLVIVVLLVGIVSPSSAAARYRQFTEPSDPNSHPAVSASAPSPSGEQNKALGLPAVSATPTTRGTSEGLPTLPVPGTVIDPDEAPSIQPLATLPRPSPAISTVAGYSGSGRPATSVGMAPTGIALRGNELVIADTNANVIRSVDLSSGSQVVIAGKASAGPAGDGGAAADAQFNGPAQVSLDSSGNVYVADTLNHKIRKVDRSRGRVIAVAGDGTMGFGGDGGPATLAKTAFPRGVALDPSGNVYFSDTANNRIRRVDVATGEVTTVAGTGIAGFGGDGGPATAAQLNGPTYLAYDPRGWLWFSDTGNRALRGLSLPSGEITTVAGGPSAPDDCLYGCAEPIPTSRIQFNTPLGIGVGSNGTLYVADFRLIWEIDLATHTGKYSFDYKYIAGEGVAVAPTGHLYIAKPRLSEVTKYSIPITVPGERVAGNGTPGLSGDGDSATRAQLAVPAGVATDPEGNTYIADTMNSVVRKIERATGRITTVAGGGTELIGPPSGDTAEPYCATCVRLVRPYDVAVLPSGDVLIAVAEQHSVFRLDRSGKLWRFAGTGYVTEAEVVYGRPGPGSGYEGDWGPATKAKLNFPMSVEVGKDGNVYISDWGNNRIRRVQPDGIITTFAGNGEKGFSGDGGPAIEAALNGPVGLAADAAGYLYIADSGNNRVRVVGPDGRISTVAGNGFAGYSGDGGAASAASLSNPFDVDTDDCSGRIFVADAGNHRIRVVDVDRKIYTYAGTGVGNWSGDGGPADSAALNSPLGVHVGPDGSVVIADTANQRIRKIEPFVTRPVSAEYFAEGATSGGFSTWILLSNPDPWRCGRARLSLMTGGGRREGPTVVVGRGKRVSVNLDAFIDSYDVAVVVESLDRPIYAERAMYSSEPGKQGATLAKGMKAARPHWIVPEGATEGDFETWILIANPSTTETANAAVDFLTDSGGISGPRLVVPPMSRRSVRANDWVRSFHVATTVSSSGAPVLVERAVYASGPRYFGATVAPGQQESTMTAFAEGATAGPFETWLLLANPHDTEEEAYIYTPLQADSVYVNTEMAGRVFLDYFRRGVEDSFKWVRIPPRSRISVRLDDLVDGYQVPVIVRSIAPEPGLKSKAKGIAVERVTYTTGPPYGYTAAASEGSRKAGWKWLAVEGATAGGFETWVSVFHTPIKLFDHRGATASLIFLTEDGPVEGPRIDLGVMERRTIRVSDYVRSYHVSVVVVSGPGPVLVERSVYAPSWLGGDATTGPATVLFP